MRGLRLQYPFALNLEFLEIVIIIIGIVGQILASLTLWIYAKKREIRTEKHPLLYPALFFSPLVVALTIVIIMPILEGRLITLVALVNLPVGVFAIFMAWRQLRSRELETHTPASLEAKSDIDM